MNGRARSARRRPENRSGSHGRSRSARRRNTGDDGRSGQGRDAGRKGWIEAGRDRVEAGRRFARVSKLIVNLDELDFGELLEAQHQRTRDVIERAIRLAAASQIDMQAAICKLDSAVTRKTVADHRKALITFHIARALEEFIEHGIDNIFGGGNHPLHCHLIRELTGNQAVIIGEVDIDLHELRCPRR